MAPLTLLSLNQDVLREILAHLLLDTPRELNRTSILRTCSSLYHLGLPLLYKILDLMGTKAQYVLMKHWKTLFGAQGVLTTEGRNIEVGTFVRELKLEGAISLNNASPGFRIPKLNIPNCSSLLLDFHRFGPFCYPSLPVILSHLTPSQLAIRDHPVLQIFNSSLARTYGRPLMNALGLKDCGALWRRLDVLIFEGYLWYDETIDSATSGYLRRQMISFSDRSFKVLVVRFNIGGGDEELVVDLFLDVDPRDQHTSFPLTERIELRGSLSLEGRFRERVEKREKDGLSEFERRIASMIVFVDEDGTERMLME